MPISFCNSPMRQRRLSAAAKLSSVGTAKGSGMSSGEAAAPLAAGATAKGSGMSNTSAGAPARARVPERVSVGAGISVFPPRATS